MQVERAEGLGCVSRNVSGDCLSRIHMAETTFRATECCFDRCVDKKTMLEAIEWSNLKDPELRVRELIASSPQWSTSAQ
eukprot:758358-Hanusia_phi.AAC.3